MMKQINGKYFDIDFMLTVIVFVPLIEIVILFSMFKTSSGFANRNLKIFSCEPPFEPSMMPNDSRLICFAD